MSILEAPYLLSLVARSPWFPGVKSPHWSLFRSPSLSPSLVSLLQFLCWLTAQSWPRVSNLLLCKLLRSGQSLTASRPSLLWLQCYAADHSVLCSVQLYTALYTCTDPSNVQIRTGPTLSKNCHNITQTKLTQIPPHRHHTRDPIIYWEHTESEGWLRTEALGQNMITSSPLPWLWPVTGCIRKVLGRPGRRSRGRTDFCTVISSAVQAPALPSPADTGRSFANYLHSFALFTTRGYIPNVL